MMTLKFFLAEFCETGKNVVFGKFWAILLTVLGAIILFFWKKIAKYSKQVCMRLSPLFWREDTARKFVTGRNLDPFFDKQLALYKRYHSKKYKKILATVNAYEQVPNSFVEMILQAAQDWKDNPPKMIDKFSIDKTIEAHNRNYHNDINNNDII